MIEGAVDSADMLEFVREEDLGWMKTERDGTSARDIGATLICHYLCH